MGLYDTIIFNCRCGSRVESQTKTLGRCNLDIFIVGDIEPENVIRGKFNSIFEEKLFNCLFRVKEKCPHCKVQNIIKIVNGELIEVVKDKNELMLIELNDEYVIEEGLYGDIVNGIL